MYTVCDAVSGLVYNTCLLGVYGLYSFVVCIVHVSRHACLPFSTVVMTAAKAHTVSRGIPNSFERYPYIL